MHLSWVRDGIFVLGMDNEMQIYSQWKDTFSSLTDPSGGNNYTSNDGILFQTNFTAILAVHIGCLGQLGEDSESDLNSDVEGSSFLGYDDNVGEDRDVLDRELHSLAQEGNPLHSDSRNVRLTFELIPGRLTYAPSMSQLPRASSVHALAAAQGSMKRPKKTPIGKSSKDTEVTCPSVSLLQDCLPSYGLFEASQIACPVLPQYHPQQLMELLNSGRIE